MKKRILAVLVALLLLCLPLAVQAEEIVTVPNNRYPAAAEPVTFYTNGDTVMVTLALPEAYSAVSSGSVEVFYDTDHLELTEIEWAISGTLIKHFDPETGRGVFSFGNPKTLEGDLISLFFKVGASAPNGDYTVRPTVQLLVDGTMNTVEFASTFTVDTPVGSESTVSTADFIAAVSALSEMTVSEADYEAICNALTLYESLSETQKRDVSGSYQLLKVKVEGYNAVADVANTRAEDATGVAFSAMARAFSFLSELFGAFRNYVWVLR